MRIFHVNVFEGYITENQNLYSSPSLSDLFGSVDRLSVGGYATEIAGGSPNLTIWEQGSVDGENWVAINTFFGGTISGAEFLIQGNDIHPDNPFFGIKTPFRRLLLTLTGAGASAMLRVWVTGRDKSRRAKALAHSG